MKTSVDLLPLVPQNSESILGEIHKIDISDIEWNKLSFDQITASVEWIFYVGNDWIDNESYWTHGEHWGGKTNQRNLAFIEFIDKMKNTNRNTFNNTLLTQLPRLKKRFCNLDISKIKKLIHLYIVVECLIKFNIHIKALDCSGGEIFQAPRNGFNHNGKTGHGVSITSENSDSKYTPIGLDHTSTMRML